MIQLVLNLVKPSEGSVLRYKNDHIEQSIEEWKKDVGFVFDDLSIYDDMHLT